MVQAINKLHPHNILKTYTDDCYYVYKNNVFSKPLLTNYIIKYTVNDYNALINFPREGLKNFDVFKVLSDSHYEDYDIEDSPTTYYMWDANNSTFICYGTSRPSYTPTYYKFYDININDLNPYNYNEDDYIITHKSIINYLKYSESFKKEECKINDMSVWKFKYLSSYDSSEYKFPNTSKYAIKIQTNNSNTDGPTEHSLSQYFYTNTNEYYIASCYVKQVSETTNNLSFQFFNDSYGVGVSAKFDLNNNEDYINDYKSVDTTFIDKNFNETSVDVTDHFYNCTAGIYRINSDSNERYFRLVIKCSCDFFSQMRVKLLILNNNSDYQYSSREGEELYLIYTNAFQLEKYPVKLRADFNNEEDYNAYLNDLKDKEPSPYIVTTNNNSVLKIFDKMYRVNFLQNVKSFKELSGNKVYYIYDIKEHTETTESGVKHVLDSYKPSFEPISDDIALVPSLLAFTSSKDKNYFLTCQTYGGSTGIAKAYDALKVSPKNGQYVLVKHDENHNGKKSIYQYSNNVWLYVLFDDSILKLGDTYISDNPAYTLNYDVMTSSYKFKIGNSSDPNTNISYKLLSYISDKKNMSSIVHSMTFNQGYFETWNKQYTGNVHKFGYNTGGGFNYHRYYKFFRGKR